MARTSSTTRAAATVAGKLSTRPPRSSIVISSGCPELVATVTGTNAAGDFAHRAAPVPAATSRMLPR